MGLVEQFGHTYKNYEQFGHTPDIHSGVPRHVETVVLMSRAGD